MKLARIRSILPPGILLKGKREELEIFLRITCSLVNKAQCLLPSSVSQGTNTIIFPLEAQNSHDQWGNRFSLYGREGSTGQRGKMLKGKNQGLVPGRQHPDWLRFGVVRRDLSLPKLELKTWVFVVDSRSKCASTPEKHLAKIWSVLLRLLSSRLAQGIYNSSFFLLLPAMRPFFCL